MQSSKSQILTALKRRGRCSVDELAAALGLAPMTVRQHLATLERDELVASTEERQRLGRPHFVYFLTDKGEASFPAGYDRLAAQMLHAVSVLQSDEIAGLTAEQKTALLFDKVAERFIGAHCTRMRSLSLPERVAAVTELLRREGGFAEWTRTSEGFEILDYNCLYRRLSGKEGGPCRWHSRILSELLEHPVESRAAAPPYAQLCHFAVLAGALQAEQFAIARAEYPPITSLPLRTERTASRLPLDAV